MSLSLSPRWDNLLQCRSNCADIRFILKITRGITSKAFVNSTKHTLDDEEINQFYFYEVSLLWNFRCIIIKDEEENIHKMRIPILNRACLSESWKVLEKNNFSNTENFHFTKQKNFSELEALVSGAISKNSIVMSDASRQHNERFKRWGNEIFNKQY